MTFCVYLSCAWLRDRLGSSQNPSQLRSDVKRMNMGESGVRKKLTVKEAGEIAGVSPALVYQWCQEQRLPHYRFGTEGRRGKILIDPDDLEAFMRQCRVNRHPLLEPE